LMDCAYLEFPLDVKLYVIMEINIIETGRLTIAGSCPSHDNPLCT